MQALVSLVLSTIAVFVAAFILPGVQVDSLLTAVVVAVLLGLINAFIEPILFVLTLPITVLTLGLFTFVLMALMVMLVSALVPGFVVTSFWWALAFALVLSVINAFLESL